MFPLVLKAIAIHYSSVEMNPLVLVKKKITVSSADTMDNSNVVEKRMIHLVLKMYDPFGIENIE